MGNGIRKWQKCEGTDPYGKSSFLSTPVIQGLGLTCVKMVLDSKQGAQRDCLRPLVALLGSRGPATVEAGAVEQCHETASTRLLAELQHPLWHSDFSWTKKTKACLGMVYGLRP